MSHRVGRHLRHNVVGYVALFVALGGASYAAVSLPKNSVGQKQIKKGAVTRSKLANRAVNGSKVATGSLTGKQIKSSTLGQVPSAAHAASADTATNAAHAGSADTAAHASAADLLGGSASSDFFPASKVRTFNVKLAFGQTQTLFTVGTLTFSAKCVQSGTDPDSIPNRDFVELLVATTQNGGIVTNGSGDGLHGDGPTEFLNTDTTEDLRALTWVAANTGTSYGDIENDGDGYGMQVVDPNGVAVIFPDGQTGAVNLFGSNCLLAGYAIIP
jgi:hypothetical protein